MRTLSPKAVAFASLALFALAPVRPAHAGEQVYAAAFGPFTVNGTSRTLAIPQFAATGVGLANVNITLQETVSGTVQAENQSTDPATVVETLSATVRLSLAGKPLLTDMPSVRVTRTLPPFDGLTDFGGTSGVTDTLTSTEGFVVTNSLDGPFTGTGDLPLTLTLTAFSTSVTFGPEVVVRYAPVISGIVVVRYTFVSPVPAPGLTALAAGALGLTTGRRRRR